MSRPKCESRKLGIQCPTWPTWKVREKGDTLARNWLYACGRHINEIAQIPGWEVGIELDLVRIKADE